MPKKTTTPPEKEVEKQAPALIAANTVVKITVPWKKAEGAYQKARGQVARTAKIAGFRKGKVPPDVAEKMMGSEDIIEKALEQILPEIYLETIKAEKKVPLTQPSFRAVSLVVGEDWVLEAEIAEKPEVQLGEYKKYAAQAHKHVAEELKKRAAAPQEKTAESETKNEAAQTQELTEEQKREMKLQHIYQHLVEAIKPQIPELLVRREVEYDLEQLGRQLQALNMTFQGYLERRKITQEMLTQQMALSALGRLQLLFISDAIAQLNKFEVTEKEVSAYIAEKVEKSMQEQYTKSAEYKRMIHQTLLRQKVAEHLLAE